MTATRSVPYVPQPLYLFDSAWQAPEIQRLLDTAFADWLARSMPADEQTLYHYTDLGGLRGILADRSLWLTHAFGLNDPAELDYGVTLISREIETAIEAHAADTPAHQGLTQLRTSVRSSFGVLHHAYVASFCEDGDLLSQWREYGARGGGYAVGIGISERTHLGIPDTQHEDPNPYFRKILYDAEEQGRLVRSFLDAYLEAIAAAVKGSALNLHPSERSIAPTWMAAHAANYFFDLAISFKQPAFSEEREWRLIRVLIDNGAADELRFREARGELVPYRPATLYDVTGDDDRAFPLREIRFGPTLNVRASSAAISLLVAHEATRRHRISVPSYVPVRSAAAALR